MKTPSTSERHSWHNQSIPTTLIIPASIRSLTTTNRIDLPLYWWGNAQIRATLASLSIESTIVRIRTSIPIVPSLHLPIGSIAEAPYPWILIASLKHHRAIIMISDFNVLKYKSIHKLLHLRHHFATGELEDVVKPPKTILVLLNVLEYSLLAELHQN